MSEPLRIVINDCVVRGAFPKVPANRTVTTLKVTNKTWNLNLRVDADTREELHGAVLAAAREIQEGAADCAGGTAEGPGFWWHWQEIGD